MKRKMLQYWKIIFFMKNKDDSLGMHPTKSVLYSESQKYRSNLISENFIRNTGSGWLTFENWDNQSENDDILFFRLIILSIAFKRSWFYGNEVKLMFKNLDHLQWSF